MLTPFRSARYTVLTSPNKDETAVHGHGLSLSVFVVLMSRKANFFCVVSALQLSLYVRSMNLHPFYSYTPSPTTEYRDHPSCNTEIDIGLSTILTLHIQCSSTRSSISKTVARHALVFSVV